ncbi:MAG: EVE domain-containing protein [Deltaproteobacteria bacterium]|nr:EVE domain-containing protein [Deltaproteobacteria bacterium]
MAAWLMKSEPEVFSIDDLAKAKTTFWDGVRNYQARNLMRDDMKPGDLVLFYHSNAKPPGVAGVAEVIKAARPDPSQFDATSEKFDPGATPAEPRWFGVDIKFRSKFATPVSLDTIKATPALANMVLVKRSRLSVQPVTDAEFKAIEKLGGSAKRASTLK